MSNLLMEAEAIRRTTIIGPNFRVTRVIPSQEEREEEAGDLKF